MFQCANVLCVLSYTKGGIWGGKKTAIRASWTKGTRLRGSRRKAEGKWTAIVRDHCISAAKGRRITANAGEACKCSSLIISPVQACSYIACAPHVLHMYFCALFILYMHARHKQKRRERNYWRRLRKPRQSYSRRLPSSVDWTWVIGCIIQATHTWQYSVNFLSTIITTTSPVPEYQFIWLFLYSIVSQFNWIETCQ